MSHSELYDAASYDAADSLDIAIIGMAGRFPKARNLDEFWQNQRDGVECISFFTEEEVIDAGVDPALARDPHYVKAGGVLEDADLFDASFFGFYPREAALMDPQHRVFLECSWEALEHAGYDSESYKGLIGVYAGTSINTYLLFNLLSNPALTDATAIYQLAIGNDKDFLPTRVSYKLNLRGPSINIQTACSTSLVATHLACQGLLNYQCDMALAGGVAIRLPQKRGYLYQEGGIASPDGHCRAFDAQAQGTIGGNGVGIVVLKRLADALADGDTIHAVIKGSAINNDGSLKVGYTAPSVDGQADVIATAQAIAGVDPGTISYIEAHGTGTSLGDPIEIAALTQAFRAGAQAKGFCAISAVKASIGHLDAGAGVAGLIKTVLALEHKQIPPSVNYEQPNPQIDFENSPFYVNAELSDWEASDTPRRAGVSSFGMGGTNAHVVVEEPPALEPSGPSRPWQLFSLSARTSTALDAATTNLVEHLKQHPSLNLADVAYTCHVGRKSFEHRRMVICRDVEDAVTTLETLDPQRVLTASQDSADRPVVFMFTGQGSQYVNMGLGLYRTEPTFREQVDRCAELLEPHLGLDLRTLLYPEAGEEEAATEQLKQTAFTQPALFTIEYALAKLWMEWGVRPQAMIGHSSGEYVAACLAGVFSLEDALSLVAARGRMMQSMPGGAMLSVSMTEAEIRPYLNDELALGVINAPSLCVISGTTEGVDALEAQLVREEKPYRRLHTSHAFHSPMMEPILDPFAGRVAQVDLHPPQIPFVSNVTGTWITAEEATDPRYWAKHLRQTVRFADGVGELLKEPARILLEVGPGRTLSSLARHHPDFTPDRAVLSSIRHPKSQESDEVFALTTLGRLWFAGAKIDWRGFYSHERRRRLPLPTYPFERKRYWVEPLAQTHGLDTRPREPELRKNPDVAEWFYEPSWKRADLPPAPDLTDGPARWLVFDDESGLGSQLAQRLEQRGQDVFTVKVGAHFDRLNDHAYVLNPGEPADYDALFHELRERDQAPDTIVHLWSVTPDGNIADEVPVEEAQELGAYSLLFLAQSLARQTLAHSPQIGVISTNVQEVTGEERLCPAKATLLGPARVIPQEYPGIVCRSIDINAPEPGTVQAERLVDRLVAEFVAPPTDPVVAYRGNHRWVQTFEPVPRVPPLHPSTLLRTGAGGDRGGRNGADEGAARLREGGVYLITGGLGRIGLVLAEYLAQAVHAKLVLVGRPPFPERGEWERWLAAHKDEDRVSQRIRKLQALEKLGAEVIVASADVANLEQMQGIIARTHERFGPLNGVVHAAGIVGEAAVSALQETDAVTCQRQFQSKVYGLLALEEALRDESLDFCILQSSLSSVLGGLGFAAYAAANAFMDAFAHKHNQASPVPWVSVNWDGWQFGDGPAQAARSEVAELAITPEEGVEAFQHILSLNGAPQIIVSTGDLQARLEKWVRREPEEEAERPEEKPAGPRFPRPQLSNPYVAPRNELEQAIADLWQEVLGIEQVGVHDDFFELGGHSLLATQIISRLRDTYQVELPLRRIFENPTVAGLAGIISEGQEEAASGLAAPPIQPVPREGDLPLSFGQQRLWFLDQLEPGSSLYNNFAAVRLSGSLDVEVLEQCANAIVQRHEVLRTTFDQVEGRPVQIIAPELTLSLPVMDLTHLSEAEQGAQIMELAIQEARQPFDLTQGPLTRLTLLRLGGGEHVIFMTMHHIISDGWSVGVLIQEIAALYDGFSAGKPSPLPEMPIQYVDYVHWQRQWLQGEVVETQLAHWKEQLGDNPPALELPTDRPRPAVQTSNGANQWFELPRPLYQALDDLSQQEGATLFMTLMAVLQTLLYRYTGQEDISIGTPIANRNRSATEGLIGFLLNTLVIRTDLSGDVTFRELLARVRETALEAYAHQDLPFEMLVEALQPERDMSRSPLFQVMFDLQVAPLESLELPGLTLSPLKVDNGTAKFDLALSMEQGEGGLGGYLNYNTDLFDAVTIERMLAHFQTLLEGIVADPDQPVSTLPLLTVAERQQLLIEWNEMTTDYPHRCIHQLFEAQAVRNPNKTAVVCGEDSLTYRELSCWADQLAHHLHTLGVEQETMAGIYMERSPEMIVGLLGILKAGGVYVPLDPQYPSARVELIRGDADLRVILTTPDLLPAWSDREDDLDIVDICAVSRLDAGGKEKTTLPEDSSEQLAYVLYTSGSTGSPKGVMIEHHSVLAMLYGYELLAPSDARLVGTSVCPFGFDVSVWEFFSTLCFGGTLHILHSDTFAVPESFAHYLVEHRVTSTYIPPALLDDVAEQLEELRDQVLLERILVGVEPIKQSTLQRFRDLSEQMNIVNGYGPTETTICATFFDFKAAVEPERRTPIGYAVPNYDVHIVGKNMQLVPAGVTGEILIGGPGLARGYLNAPEPTAQKFIPHPFADSQNERVYRTGDLARRLPDGRIEFVGRVDHQIKIRGFRVELGEIETILVQHAEVSQVVVLARENRPGQKQLVAYVVPAAETAPVVADLRTYLKERLPAHMVPAAFVPLEALPLTPVGKVDRRALPVPDQARPELEAVYIAPRTPVEEELTGMWAEVLDVDRVGIYDNFFDLGGHSLMATRLISRVRASYQVDLPLRRLFETPTVAGLATLVEESLVEQEDEEELARMLAEMEDLSEEEVRELLAEEMVLQ